MAITRLELRRLRLDEPQLKRLPLRAIVALSARCARRVQSLYDLPAWHPGAEQHRAALDEALGLADAFASGMSFSPIARAVEAVENARLAAVGLNDDGCAFIAAGAALEATHAVALACEAINNLDLEVNSRRGMGQWQWPVGAPNVLDRVAHVAADLSVLAALRAAEEAIGADDGLAEGLVAATYLDYYTLVRLDLGSFPDEGMAVDPSADGPLGPFHSQGG
ncbi:MAG TPA: hypothetical protein VGH33_09225 [Isosphaeraceae bacterium]